PSVPVGLTPPFAPELVSVPPAAATPEDKDRTVDVLMGRATWAAHAVIRRFLFVAALAYMTWVQWLAMHTYASDAPELQTWTYRAGRGVLIVASVGLLRGAWLAG